MVDAQTKDTTASPHLGASIDPRESLQESPQNALRLLLAPASHDLPATALGATVGETRIQDDGANSTPASFLSLATNPQHTMLGVHPTSAILPTQQQLHHQYQQQQPQQMLTDNILNLQQQQQQLLLQMQLQRQQGDQWLYQSSQMMQENQQLQQLLQLQPAQGPYYNALQPEAIDDQHFARNAGPPTNSAGEVLTRPEMMMNTTSQFQAGVWDSVMEPRPLAPHAWTPSPGWETAMRRELNPGESKNNESFNANGADVTLQNELLQQWLLTHEGRRPSFPPPR